jgi:hypothetical protein
MKVVSVATSDSRAYYSILSRLKRTHLGFVSVVPSEGLKRVNEPVITTRSEMRLFDCVTIPIEELSDNPLVMEGQILSRVLAQEKRVLLIGVDPGSRIGIAVYYGGFQLGLLSVSSGESLRKELLAFTQLIPNVRAIVKIGNGAPTLSASLVQMLLASMPNVAVEIVDERGTSIKTLKGGGLTVDEAAAIRIAFRKGALINKRAAC